MFPIRDDNPHIRVPYATFAIIGLNVIAWVVLQGAGIEPQLSRSICQLALIPGELLGHVEPGVTIRLGAETACSLGATNTWHTVVTSMFMHGGWLHIIGNVWFLWIFGGNVEDAMGHARFVIFYLLCGAAAAAAQVLANPESTIPMVGASGAIGGVMGAYIILYPRVNVHLLIILGFFVTTVAVPAIFMLAYWFVLQLISGVVSLNQEGGGVAFWAHAGGFVAGSALVFLFRNMRFLREHPCYGWHASPSKSFRRIKR